MDDTISDLANDASAAVDKTATSVGDAVSKVGESARELRDAARRQLDATAGTVRTTAAESPIITLLTAAGVGLAVGLFLNRDR